MQAPRISVAGGTAVGLLVQVEHPPRPGETIIAKSMAYIDGGKAAGQAIGVARLGANAFLVSALGDDALGDRLRELLARERVDTSGVRTFSGEGSMLGLVLIDESGENQITVALNALAKMEPDHVRAGEEVIANSDVCLVSLEIPIESAIETLKIARENGVKTILNPAPAPPGDVLDVLVPLADVITPNETEAATITGAEDSPEGLARRLMEMGADAVAMTLGAEGALFVDAHETFRVPTPQVAAHDIVDTSGAGDAFNAAFAVAIAMGKSPRDACTYGCEAGSRIVQGPGFVEALHTWDGFEIS